jgi:hypothetical protein
MDFKEQLSQKIKEKFGTKAEFCKENGHDYSSFNKKQQTVISKIRWLNEFLEPLDLEVTITEK